MGNCENDSYTTHFERKKLKRQNKKSNNPILSPFPSLILETYPGHEEEHEKDSPFKLC